MADEEERKEQISYEDERIAKSEAVRYLGIVPTNSEERMARSRFTRRQIAVLAMQETQEQALNPKRPIRFLSATWRHILARDLFALDGLWRVEMQSILETQSEERAAEIATRE